MINIDELIDVDRIARVEIARKVGKILQKEASGLERESALKVAHLLVEDTSIAVREALSLELRKCEFIPAKIIEALVDDIDQVSMPFLMVSGAVNDELLEKLIYNSGEAAQEAIAKRDGLCEAVSFAICDFAGRDAVENLMENETADVSSRAAVRVTERFAEDRPLLELLASRTDLPMDVVENIIFKISKQYGKYLMEKFNLSEDYSSYLIAKANNKVFSATLNVSPMNEVMNYLSQLHEARGLTADQLLIYLQSEHLRLFTATLSVMTNKAYSVIEKGLAQGGSAVLLKLLNQAKVPKSISGVLLVAYERELLRHK